MGSDGLRRARTSSYAPDDRARRLLRRARLRPVLPSLGFGVMTVAMMVTGGLSVAIPTIAFVLVLYGGGVIWAQRFQDRKDAESQARVLSGDIVATPAVLTRQTALATQQGELRISPSGFEWIPRPPSRQASLSVPREQITTVSVAPGGLPPGVPHWSWR